MHTVSNTRPPLRVTLGQHGCDTTALAVCAISGDWHAHSQPWAQSAPCRPLQLSAGAAQMHSTAAHTARLHLIQKFCHMEPVTCHLQKQSCRHVSLPCRPSTRPSCCSVISTCSGRVGQGATLRQTVPRLTMQRCGGCTASACDCSSGSLTPLAAKFHRLKLRHSNCSSAVAQCCLVQVALPPSL